jgi:hypothetical protein
MLALRSSISFALLFVLAAVFAFSGHDRPFTASSAWWLWIVTVTNFASLAFLLRSARNEGLRLRDLCYISGATWKGDLLWAIGAFVVTSVVAMLPGTALANALWGSTSVPNNLLFQPIPEAAIWPLFLLMPTSHALVELPVYWGYAAPRLKARGMNRWLVILVVGSVLSIQHLFFSFQPDWRYCLWLGLKFLPFALWTGFVMDKRPTVLPYLMAFHLVIDSSLPFLALSVSRGGTL